MVIANGIRMGNFSYSRRGSGDSAKLSRTTSEAMKPSAGNSVTPRNVSMEGSILYGLQPLFSTGHDLVDRHLGMSPEKRSLYGLSLPSHQPTSSWDHFLLGYLARESQDPAIESPIGRPTATQVAKQSHCLQLSRDWRVVQSLLKSPRSVRFADWDCFAFMSYEPEGRGSMDTYSRSQSL